MSNLIKKFKVNNLEFEIKHEIRFYAGESEDHYFIVYNYGEVYLNDKRAEFSYIKKYEIGIEIDTLLDAKHYDSQPDPIKEICEILEDDVKRDLEKQ